MGREFNIYKSDDDKRLVFGWASIAIRTDGTQIEDFQGDMFDPEDLEEAAYDYVLNFRDAGEEHNPGLRKKAKLVESVVLTKEKQAAMGVPEGIVPEGWWIGFKVHDTDTWDKIKRGEYSMFSIEGQGIREKVNKSRSLTFKDALRKFNPYHDALGRFTGPGGATSFTIRTKDPSKQGLADNARKKEHRRTSAASAKTIHQISGQEMWDNAHKAYDSMTDEERWRVGIDDHSVEELDSEAKCFSTADGSSFAVKSDGDMISLCKMKSDPVYASELIKAAVEAGGRKMDAFGPRLYKMYTQNGFEPVSHCSFDDEYAPDAWKRANGFKADDTSWHGIMDSELEVPRESIVFYRYTGKQTTITYDEFLKNTQVSSDYDSAQKARNEAME